MPLKVKDDFQISLLGAIAQKTEVTDFLKSGWKHVLHESVYEFTA